MECQLSTIIYPLKTRNIMRLTEDHKQFVVEGYAKFMKRADIIDTFVERFSDEIEEYCGGLFKTRDEYIQDTLETSHHSKFSEDQRIELFNEEYDDFKEPIIRHLKRKFSTQFRRLDIEHSQFPEKYRELFHRTREEHLNKETEISLSDIQYSLSELVELYDNVKRMIFVENQYSQLPLAHNILKTIIAYQLTEGRQEILDVIPDESKMIENNSEDDNEFPQPEIEKNDPNNCIQK